MLLARQPCYFRAPAVYWLPWLAPMPACAAAACRARRVRHEAGEALGAIGTEECLAPLREHLRDPCAEVAHTCQLALQRIEHFAAVQAQADAAAAEAGTDAAPSESRYYSVDPTPAAPAATPLSQLRATLLSEEAPIFQRYRAMFALRNRGGGDAVAALGASFTAASSALLKHEVAYVLGQMQDAAAVQTLK